MKWSHFDMSCTLRSKYFDTERVEKNLESAFHFLNKCAASEYWIRFAWNIILRKIGFSVGNCQDVIHVIRTKFPWFWLQNFHNIWSSIYIVIHIVADNGRLSIHHYLGDNSLPLYSTCLYVGRIFVSSTSTWRLHYFMCVMCIFMMSSMTSVGILRSPAIHNLPINKVLTLVAHEENNSHELDFLLHSFAR